MVTLPQASADDGLDFFLLGTVNPDDTEVLITGNENIDSAASGQARVLASDNTTLNFLQFNLESGFGADSFVFNLNNFGKAGSVTLSGVDQFGATYNSAPLTLGVGQNFFNLTTLDNQLIRQVSFTSTALVDVRQIRFGDVQALPGGVTAIPEPATWALMIGGFGGAGAMLRRNRRIAVVA